MSAPISSYDESRNLVNGNNLGANPGVNIFLRPIAAPAALGLAGFAGSTWIVSSYIANWWSGSPTVFFPFVLMWGGLAQFIAGIQGFPARDTLATVFHTLWGSFWISVGIVWLLAAVGTVPAHTLHGHFPEFAAWAVVLMVFTWICAIGAFARDMIYFSFLTSLAIGSTLAVGGWYSSSSASGATIKAAAYFWMLSSLLATWRAAVIIWEENHGGSRFYPTFRHRRELDAPYLTPGFGEPGVRRGMGIPLEGTGTGTGAATRKGAHSQVPTEGTRV